MQRWEYKVVEKENKDKGRDIAHELNRLGQEGWELVAATEVCGDVDWVMLYLKRPV